MPVLKQMSCDIQRDDQTFRQISQSITQSFKSQSPGKCTAVEKCPFAIQFLGAHVIVIGVSDICFF